MGFRRGLCEGPRVTHQSQMAGQSTFLPCMCFLHSFNPISAQVLLTHSAKTRSCQGTQHMANASGTSVLLQIVVGGRN